MDETLLDQLTRAQTELAFKVLAETWGKEKSKMLIPEELQHLSLMEWDLLAWSLLCLQRQKNHSRIH